MKCDLQQIQAFIYKYIDKPISFFAEIKNDIEKRRIKKYIDSKNPQHISAYIDACLNHQKKEIEIQELYSMANERLESLEIIHN